MGYFGRFYLDKEKDMIVTLYLEGEKMSYVLSTPNHTTGNLITNFAKLCGLPVSEDENGLKIIRGTVPCYIDDRNHPVYIFRLRDTKVANIHPDGTIERKASVPAISKTLMSQTKDYRLSFSKTVVKTYLRAECKFRADLHTHMNANLEPDVLIALGIHHQIRYPLYYILKLGLRVSERQKEQLQKFRERHAAEMKDSPLQGKYRERRINDMTYLSFADLILGNPADASYNIPRIRASLAVMKDGQAVFTDLEKVYLYRYVFTKGKSVDEKQELSGIENIPDEDIVACLHQMEEDREGRYPHNSLFQDLLLWIARGYAKRGIRYAEISDTTLVKRNAAAAMLQEVHDVMPRITEETGVTLRFLAGIRRIPLTIVKDHIAASGYLAENLQVLRAVAVDPYVAGSDIIGEEINDVRELKPLIAELVKIAAEIPGFVIRIHAGENDCLRDNVANSIRCVKEALLPGQKMPRVRIGHGLYTANLKSRKGQALIRELKESKAVLEFQISSNVRLNNLSNLSRHPLKQYLAAGISCVQGTDGGALYGTDSIDEQLSLEKMLDLTDDEMMQMKEAETKVLNDSLAVFEEKKKQFASMLKGSSVQEFLLARQEAGSRLASDLLAGSETFDTAEVLREQITQLDSEKLPVVVAGGSFNNDAHETRMTPEGKALLDMVIDHADPDRYFFVIGHTLSGYEKYVAEKCRGRFEVAAIVPARLTRKEYQKLKKGGIAVRPSIEPSPMAIYKSFNYDIFKRRRYVLIALDGNSAAANLVQEARNGRAKHGIYISSRCRMLAHKAGSLKGYAMMMEKKEDAAEILKGMELYYHKMQKDRESEKA